MKILVLCLAVFQASTVLTRAEEYKLELKSSGGSQMSGGYMPQRAPTSATVPASLRKAPDGLVEPAYGVIRFGAKESPSSLPFIVDMGGDKPWRLFLDANANGDLTDDGDAVKWAVNKLKGRDGTEHQQGSGSAMIRLTPSDPATAVKISFYVFDPKEERRPKNMLLYYADYARSGSLELGGKQYKAMLHDQLAKGDYRDASVVLKLDVNEDGKFDFKAETFSIQKPFNIAGTTYEITGVSATGDAFQIVKSSQTVAETKPLQVIAPGKPAPTFEAMTLTGEKISLPGSYKGKLVLLDFWATWCGPCIGELPNLVKAYEAYHAKGLEVLGISLDSENTMGKLPDFLKSHNMTWPQVCDGKGWEAELGKLYAVRGIPAAFLIDGTTGNVIAVAGLRGPELAETIQAALDGKLPAKTSASRSSSAALQLAALEATRRKSSSPVKTGAASEAPMKSNLSEILNLARTDRPAAIKAIQEGLQTDPLKSNWGLSAATIFKSDENKAKGLKGEARKEHFTTCRDYLLRTLELTDAALTKHPGNISLLHQKGELNSALARARLETGELAEAKKQAEEMLAANVEKTNWNYGNVIHAANSVLGRAALREGDQKLAAEYLLKAGATPGSPQLNSFGPDFTFAREMAEAGQNEAVLAYFDLVQKFWVDKKDSSDLSKQVSDANQRKLDSWRSEIAQGKVPEFKPY